MKFSPLVAFAAALAGAASVAMCVLVFKFENSLTAAALPIVENTKAAADKNAEAKNAAYLAVGYLAGHTMADCKSIKEAGNVEPATCAETRAKLKALAEPMGIKHLGTAF